MTRVSIPIASARRAVSASSRPLTIARASARKRNGFTRTLSPTGQVVLPALAGVLLAPDHPPARDPKVAIWLLAAGWSAVERGLPFEE